MVERDKLPGGAELRKGVPQAAHAHGLLASGYRVMDGYFPGMMDSLRDAGVPFGDVSGDFLWFQYGRWKLRHQSGLKGIVVSRPALEAAVRDGVRKVPNIRILDDTDADVPTYDAGRGAVTGVKVTNRTNGQEEELGADLVVDATGRGSQAPKWLEQWGFGRPQEVTVKVDVGYATRVFKRGPGDFHNSVGAVIAGRPPEESRFAAVLAAEGPRWVVTLAGMIGDYPPTDEEGWLAYAKSLPTEDTYRLATTAEPIGGYDYRGTVDAAPIAAITPTAAAGAILRGVARNQACIVFPVSNRLLLGARRVLPGLVDYFTSRQLATSAVPLEATP